MTHLTIVKISNGQRNLQEQDDEYYDINSLKIA
jgi:hypothetical protein